MVATMSQSNRIRVTVDVSDAHKRAFYARANFEGKTPQELFEALVETYAPEEFARAVEMVAEGDQGDEGKPKKGERKPGKK